MDDVRYIARYFNVRRGEWKRSGMFKNRAHAENRVRKLKAKGFKAHVAAVAPPVKILTFGKYSTKRLRIRAYLRLRGFLLTGGDRTPERNEQVGGVPNSAHLTTRTDVFADDFYFPDRDRMIAEAIKVANKFGVETLVHDVGSGQHLHVEGRK